jgi:hypothetical protein
MNSLLWYVINQQKCISVKYVWSYIIHWHVLAAYATIIRVSYKNTNNIQIIADIYIYCLYSCMTPWWWSQKRQTCRWVVIYNKTYFADVHWLVYCIVYIYIYILYCTNMEHMKFLVMNFIIFVLSRFRNNILAANKFNHMWKNEIWCWTEIFEISAWNHDIVS